MYRIDTPRISVFGTQVCEFCPSAIPFVLSLSFQLAPKPVTPESPRSNASSSRPPRRVVDGGSQKLGGPFKL